MTKNKIKTIPLRRKREGRTDYRKRMLLLKSKKERIVIRKFSGNMIIQIITYNPNGDKVLITTSTKELKKYGWELNKGNIPSAYLAGYLCGIKAKKKKINEAIVDIGLQTPKKNGKIFAAVKGAIEAGLKINCPEEALPSIERINGKHIQDYFSLLSENKKENLKQFSNYSKNKIEIKDINNLIKNTKQNIDKEGAKI